MSIVHFDRSLRRLWFFHRRCHHGAFGLALISVGIVTQNPWLIVAGAGLAWHDRGDKWWAFTEEDF